MNKSRIYKPDATAYAHATKLLHGGELVSFPTETVYGLGANALDSKAVAKIYSAKNRPSFNPLIVHVANKDTVLNYVEMNDQAQTLAEKFWPGPFTMVLPIKQNCGLSNLITAGLDTVAIRVPENVVAHELITEFDGPIAAPSANKSGKISPTTAKHVSDEFGDELSMIIDGGSCEKGIESTIVRVDGKVIEILRPGSITSSDIENAVGRKVSYQVKTSDQPNAPGQLESHYAPETKMRLNVTETRNDEALLAFGKIEVSEDRFTLNLSPSGDLIEAAANLFSMMRELDQMNFNSIAVSPIPETGLGIAINDRLRRAAAPKE